MHENEFYTVFILYFNVVKDSKNIPLVFNFVCYTLI